MDVNVTSSKVNTTVCAFVFTCKAIVVRTEHFSEDALS